MTDQVLNILKLILLGLLYLFFARVLWAVWSEVKTPVRRPAVGPRSSAPHRPRPVAPATKPAMKKSKKAKKGSRGKATRLVILEPKSRRGMTVPLVGEITLGREPECSITIDDDAFISQLHLRFYDYEGQPMVEDLGSTNGTFHNGNKLTGSGLMHPGDRVQVGTTVIEAQ
jgi:pSer/pThr/pTyr-binding forkhead associated (FHA) protein